MTKHSGDAAIDRGPASEPDRDPAREETGNVGDKGGGPSPDAAPVDLDSAHDRAS